MIRVQCLMVMGEEMGRFLNRSVWRAWTPNEGMLVVENVNASPIAMRESFEIVTKKSQFIVLGFICNFLVFSVMISLF